MRFQGLASPQYATRLEKGDALNQDIITTIEKNFPAGVKQTKQFAGQLKGSSYRDSARNVWNFLKDHITYVKDRQDAQMIKLPSRFIHDGTGDCKSYSLAAASLLQNLGVPGVRFRYASYGSSPTPTHVYVVASDENGKDIIVDGCWLQFDSEKLPAHKIDHPMKVFTLSGTGIGYADAGIPYKGGGVGGFGMWMQTFVANLKANAYNDIFAQMKSPQEIGVWLTLQQDNAMKHFGVHEGGGLLGDIEHLAGQIWDAIKLVALAPARAAYRSLLEFNVHGMANSLDEAITKDSNKVKNTWESVGGDFDALKRSVNDGKSKSAIFGFDEGVQGIGAVDNVMKQLSTAKKRGDVAGRKRILDIVNRRYRALRKYGVTGTTGVIAACNDGIGVAPLAFLAIAAPIIAAMAGVLKALGVLEKKDPVTGQVTQSGAEKIIDATASAIQKLGGDPAKQLLDPTDPKNKGKFDLQQGANDSPSTAGFAMGTAGWFLLAGIGVFAISSMKK